MSDESTDSEVQFLPTVLGRSRGGYRYMKRRRLDRLDRNGDPLDGVVNLFDVAIVLAVGFLVAALAGLGISGILTSDDMTIVTDPGTEQMQVIVKQGDEITRLDLESGAEVSGVGTLIGQFYRLADGTTVYVPAGAIVPGATTDGSVTPVPETTASPAVVPAPEAPVMPAPDEDAVSEGQPPPQPPAKKSATDVTP
ncbi:MAG: DUF2149 domain-containing protein [Thermoleophilia bacterium]|nr:DUF2149 domain-containing protein [Thermoleophilia bacterium]